MSNLLEFSLIKSFNTSFCAFVKGTSGNANSRHFLFISYGLPLYVTLFAPASKSLAYLFRTALNLLGV